MRNYALLLLAEKEEYAISLAWNKLPVWKKIWFYFNPSDKEDWELDIKIKVADIANRVIFEAILERMTKL